LLAHESQQMIVGCGDTGRLTRACRFRVMRQQPKQQQACWSSSLGGKMQRESRRRGALQCLSQPSNGGWHLHVSRLSHPSVIVVSRSGSGEMASMALMAFVVFGGLPRNWPSPRRPQKPCAAEPEPAKARTTCIRPVAEFVHGDTKILDRKTRHSVTPSDVSASEDHSSQRTGHTTPDIGHRLQRVRAPSPRIQLRISFLFCYQ
jgi:hypothetical protein